MLLQFVIFLIILSLLYMYFGEDFRDIDYDAEKRELQQLFSDYWNYEYKNYNFNRFLDSDGYHIYPMSLREQYEQNNQDTFGSM